MRKIVIRTNSLERSSRLVSFLRTLFPECEIEMQLVGIERHGDVSRKSAWDTKGEKINLGLEHAQQ